jgi:hypothetical protein
VVAFAGPLSAEQGFDSDHWKAQYDVDDRDNPRAGMVTALERLLTPGMSRDAVLDLLGRPESQDVNQFRYSIGVSPYGIDYEYFVVEFDRDGLVRTFIMRG